jgi:hypothetical protein
MPGVSSQSLSRRTHTTGHSWRIDSHLMCVHTLAQSSFDPEVRAAADLHAPAAHRHAGPHSVEYRTKQLVLSRSAYSNKLLYVQTLAQSSFRGVRAAAFTPSAAPSTRASIHSAHPTRWRQANSHWTACVACRRYAIPIRPAGGNAAIYAPLPPHIEYRASISGLLHNL